MDCKGCDCASKAQYLPVPAGLIGILPVGRSGQYSSVPLTALRFDPDEGSLAYLDALGEPTYLILHEPTGTVFELGFDEFPPRSLSLREWLTELRASYES